MADEKKKEDKKCPTAKSGTDEAARLCHSWNRFLQFTQYLGYLITLTAGA